MKIIDKVRRRIREGGLLRPGDRVLAALSGGADSVALLLILLELKEYDVKAAHLNHGIRGEEADGDEAFCRELCGRLGVPLETARADVPGEAKARKVSEETAARDVRYEFLCRTAAEDGRAIATAHTACDNAETVLFNMGRGTSLSGLCGIPPCRTGAGGVRIVRPLLDVTREEIEDYLAVRGQDFRTDSTNFSLIPTRNRLRRLAVPELKKIFPGFFESVSRMTGLLREDEAFIFAEAEKLAGEYRRTGWKALEGKPGALVSRVVREECERICGVPPEEVHVKAVTGLLAAGRGVYSLPGGRVAVIGGRLVPAGEEIKREPVSPVPLRKGEYPLWDGWFAAVFCSDSTEKYSCVNKKANFAALRHDILSRNPVFRTRMPGDRVFLPGRGVTKTLKKLFNEEKVPPEERDRIPVLAAGSDVYLLPVGGFEAKRTGTAGETAGKTDAFLPEEKPSAGVRESGALGVYLFRKDG